MLQRGFVALTLNGKSEPSGAAVLVFNGNSLNRPVYTPG